MTNGFSTTRLTTQEQPTFDIVDGNCSSVLALPPNQERQGEGGLRTHGVFKKSMPDKPLITVVTVVFNGEAYLEETILSVINQTYSNVEYIVIDGGSKDGTLDIIKKHENAIDYWVSEKDSGIYGAMNKGVVLASGDWINFMNAGDRFYVIGIIDTIISYLDAKYKVIYGGAVYEYDKQNSKVVFHTPKMLPLVWFLAHQTAFIRIDLMKKHKYNTAFKVAGDTDFFSRIFSEHSDFLNTKLIIAAFEAHGISSNAFNATMFKESLIIGKRHTKGFVFFLTLYYIFKVLPFAMLKRILPTRVSNTIRKMLP